MIQQRRLAGAEKAAEDGDWQFADALWGGRMLHKNFQSRSGMTTGMEIQGRVQLESVIAKKIQMQYSCVKGLRVRFTAFVME